MRSALKAIAAAAALLTLCLPACRRGAGIQRVAADALNHDFLLDLPRALVN